MKVPNLEAFSDLSKVKTTVIPILWLEEGIDELGPKIVGYLKKAVTEPREWKDIILYVWTGQSLVLRTEGKLSEYFRSLRDAAPVDLGGRGQVSPQQGQREPGGASEGTRGEVDGSRSDQRHQLSADHSHVGEWREFPLYHGQSQQDILGGRHSSLCSAQQR